VLHPAYTSWMAWTATKAGAAGQINRGLRGPQCASSEPEGGRLDGRPGPCDLEGSRIEPGAWHGPARSIPAPISRREGASRLLTMDRSWSSHR